MSIPHNEVPSLTPSEELSSTTNAQTSAQKPQVWLRFHWVLAASAFLMVFVFYSFGNFADPDIWWHLNNAEKLVTTHHLPSVDVYSYTAHGARWINHEWLAEVPYYFALKLFGVRGLYGLSLLLSGGAILAIFFRSYKYTSDIKNAFVVCVFCILLTVVSYGPRMLIFGWIFMIFMLYALDRFREGSEKWIWTIPPLFCLWINTHGSWMIGLVVFCIVAGSGLFEFESGLIESKRWSKRQMMLLGGVLLLSVMALFINPYGYHLVNYPFDMAFHQKLNVENVEEWASVNFHNARGKVAFFLICWIASSAFLTRRKWRLDEILLLILGLYSGLTYIRFLFLAAILISPMLTKNLSFFPPYDAKIDKSWLNLAVILLIFGWILYRFPSKEKVQTSMEEGYPAHSISYLREHNIKDKVLAAYLWGGYLERNYPEMPVFIDSRVDIFEYNGTLKDYLDITSMKNPLSLLDKYHIEYVYFPPNDPLPYLLRNTANWEVLNEDKTSVLLKRRVPLAAK
jgi:hypothetical protein